MGAYEQVISECEPTNRALSNCWQEVLFARHTVSLYGQVMAEASGESLELLTEARQFIARAAYLWSMVREHRLLAAPYQPKLLAGHIEGYHVETHLQICSV